MHIPNFNINHIHSLIYFFPHYLLGIIYSENRERADIWLKNNFIMISITLILCVIIMTLYAQVGNSHKINPWSWDGFDFMVLQKILLILFLMTFFRHYTPYNIQLFKYISKISFALFFIHPWIIEFFPPNFLHDYISGGVFFIINTLCITGIPGVIENPNLMA